MKKVALRKESVDRNFLASVRLSAAPRSLSARRAWIEIRSARPSVAWVGVALRKESVDRNQAIVTSIQGVFESLSARRAWIEISCTC